MNMALSARGPLHSLSRISLCVGLFFLLWPTQPSADVSPLSKVGDVIETTASSFKRVLGGMEKALGRKFLFADAVLQGDIWLLRKELRGSMKETVKNLSPEKIALLKRVDSKLKELRSELAILIETNNKDIKRISAALNSSLFVAAPPSPIKFFPRVVEPSYADGQIRIRVSGNQLDSVTLALKVTEDGVPLSPSRSAEGWVEFNIPRTDLPKASKEINYITVTLIIEEEISILKRVEKLFDKDSENRLKKLFSKDSEKRTYPVALSLLPNHMGYARVFGVRWTNNYSDVRDLKPVEDSVTSVSENGKKQICLRADRDCEIDKRSIEYKIVNWNAYYQTEYCDVLCRQPYPYNRPEGNTKGTCPLIRTPEGFRPRRTQSCEASRMEVDKAKWTAKKACVVLISRPLLRGVKARVLGKVWGKQKCLARHEERVLITKTPLRIGWTGEIIVDVPTAYEALMVELTTADGKKYALKKYQFINLYWVPKSPTAKLRPRRSFWWK